MNSAKAFSVAKAIVTDLATLPRRGFKAQLATKHLDGCEGAEAMAWASGTQTAFISIGLGFGNAFSSMLTKQSLVSLSPSAIVGTAIGGVAAVGFLARMNDTPIFPITREVLVRNGNLLRHSQHSLG